MQGEQLTPDRAHLAHVWPNGLPRATVSDHHSDLSLGQVSRDMTHMKQCNLWLSAIVQQNLTFAQCSALHRELLPCIYGRQRR